MYSRRSVIGGVTLLITTLAGCSGDISNTGDGGEAGNDNGGNDDDSDPEPEPEPEPDPEVTDINVDSDFMGSLTGTADVQVLVQNDGDEGDVEATAIILDENGNTLKRESERAYVDEGESRRIDIEMSGPDGSDRVTAEAEPA